MGMSAREWFKSGAGRIKDPEKERPTFREAPTVTPASKTHRGNPNGYVPTSALRETSVSGKKPAEEKKKMTAREWFTSGAGRLKDPQKAWTAIAEQTGRPNWSAMPPSSFSHQMEADLIVKSWAGDEVKTVSPMNPRGDEGPEEIIQGLETTYQLVEAGKRDLKILKTAVETAPNPQRVVAYRKRLEAYRADMDANKGYCDLCSQQGVKAKEYLDQAAELEEKNSKLGAEAHAMEVGMSRAGWSTEGQRQLLAQKRREIEENQKTIQALREKAETARGFYYGSIPTLEDFEKLSKPSGRKRAEGGWRPFQDSGDNKYDFINDIGDYRRYKEGLSSATSQMEKYGDFTKYTYMTPQEIGIYNYIYAKDGKDAAEEFLKDLEEVLSYRQGTEQYENLSGAGKAIYWLPAGMDQFGTGIGQLFSEEAIPTSPVQVTSSMIRQEAQEASPVLGFAYDLGTAASNMAPSILLSYLTTGLLGSAGVAAGTAGKIGGVVGRGAMSLSAGGNAYAEKVKEGYAPEQAQQYATLVGISEYTLQYLLGGISSMGGVSAEKVAAKVAGIDNALARISLTLGTKMASEGLEEGLQEVLEPAFTTLIFDEDYNVNSDDVIYAFLMGAIMAGAMEGPGVIRSNLSKPSFDAHMDGYRADTGEDYFEGCKTAEEVEARYRQLARENHPDVGGSEAVMAEINKQRDMRRAFYDGAAQAEQRKGKEQDAAVEDAVQIEQEPAENHGLSLPAPYEFGTPVGDKYYGHTISEVEDIKIEPSARTSVPGKTPAVQPVNAIDGSIRSIPQDVFGVNAESAVEPTPLPTVGGEITVTTENVNGGVRNVQEQQGRTDSSATAPVAQSERTGENFVLEGQERLHSADSRKQIEGLGAGAGGGRKRGIQTKRAGDRQNVVLARNLGRISTREAGLAEGTDTRLMTVMPDDIVEQDEELRNIRDRNAAAGYKTQFFIGAAIVGDSGSIEGWVDREKGEIWIKADSLNDESTATKINDHERAHPELERPGVMARVASQLLETHSREELRGIIASYMKKYHGLIDVENDGFTNMVGFTAAEMALLEEFCADALAGRNRLGVRAGDFHDEVVIAADENNVPATQQNAAAIDQRTGPPQESPQYSVNNSFTQELSEWDQAGQPGGERFVLGSTGDVLQGLGAIEADIYMEGDKISTIMQSHPEMTLEEIGHIPEILDDPVLVMKSRGGNRRGQNSRLVLFGSFKAQNGQPILTILDLRPVEGGLAITDMQKVNSAYTRDNALNYVRGGEILHADKNRTTQLLRSIGLHGPIELQKSGSMGSITYHQRSVNIQGVPFSEVVQQGRRLTFQEEVQRQLMGLPLETDDSSTELGQDTKYSTEDNVDPFMAEVRRQLMGELPLRDVKVGSTIETTPTESLTQGEEAALLAYKSSWSYQVNSILRDGRAMDLSTYQQVEALDRAIQKLPVYQGTVYRRLSFDTMGGKAALEAFLAEHQPGQTVGYSSFTSSSKTPDGYPIEGELTATLVIEGVNGRDVDGFGNNFEQEVLFARKSRFVIDRMETGSNGKPVIYMEEVTEDGIGQLHSQERSETVQQVQESGKFHGDLSEVSQDDPLRGAGGRGLPGVRADGDGSQGVTERGPKFSTEDTTPTDQGAPEDLEMADEFVEYTRFGADSAKRERLRNISKESFIGTPALQKLGVRIENSVGIYHFIQSMIENDKAAKSIRKEMRKAERRLAATEAERDFASGVAAGIYTQGDIPTTMDADKVMELADYYWAERAVASDMIRQQRVEINRALAEKMEELFKDADDFKPSSAIILNNRTPERNMLHIFGDERGAAINAAIFDPVAVNEAERIRFKNRMFDAVRTFEDSKGERSQLTKEERAIVQQVIEGKAAGEAVASAEMSEAIQNAAENINNGMEPGDAAAEFGLDREQRRLAERYSRWLQTQKALKSGKVDQAKVENAAKKYAELFDLFYDAINDFLVAHGYEPIGFIRGYAPHIQPEENFNLLNKSLQALGINTDVTRLPTSIAGLTSEYKPNKRWNPYFLTRTGDVTGYDIATAFESYVDYMSDVLYHTDDIMRVRQAANYFRRTYAPEEIRESLGQIEELRSAPADQKAAFLRDREVISRTSAMAPDDISRTMDEYAEKLYGDVTKTTKYSDLVMYLDNYANILAGKQSMADRGWEVSWGRGALNFGNRLVRAFGKAQVAGNLSSALNQTAQLPQIVAEVGMHHTLGAIRDMASGKLRKASWWQGSDFLTGKKGVQYLVTTPGEMVISTMFKPAEIVDGITAAIAVRGRYLKEVAAGKSHREAMKAADAFGKSVMGSRAKGSRPLAYEAKNPVSQMLHIFQVEAVNQWEHLSRDLPRDFRQIERVKGKNAAAWALAAVIIKMLLSAFFLNRITEETYGGTPAPFDILGLSANFIASGEHLTTNEWLRAVIDNGWEKLTGGRLFGTDATTSGGDFDWDAALEDTAYNIFNDIPFLRNAAGLLGLGDETLPIPDVFGAGVDISSAVKNSGLASGETGAAVANLLFQLIPGGRQLSKTAQGAETLIRGGRYKGYGDKERLQYPVKRNFWSVVRGMIFGNSGLAETEEFYSSGASGLSASQTKVYQGMVEDGVDPKVAYETIQNYRTNGNSFEIAKYRDFVEAGLDSEDALTLAEDIGSLEPEEGRKQPSNLQKFRAVIDALPDEDDQLAALSALMGENEYAKLQAGTRYGVTPALYVEAREVVAGVDDNGSVTQDEAERAIASMSGLSNAQRAVLWQLQNKSWKPGSNPFDSGAGEKVYDALNGGGDRRPKGLSLPEPPTLDDEDDATQEMPSWISLPTPGE